MRLYGRFSPPRSYPLVVPYVTPALMVCLEADTPYTISVSGAAARLCLSTLCNAHGETCVIIFAQLSSRLPGGTCDVPLLERAAGKIHLLHLFSLKR